MEEPGRAGRNRAAAARGLRSARGRDRACRDTHGTPRQGTGRATGSMTVRLAGQLKFASINLATLKISWFLPSNLRLAGCPKPLVIIVVAGTWGKMLGYLYKSETLGLV